MTDRPLLGLPRPGLPGRPDAMALLALLALAPAACTSSTGEPAGAQAWIRPAARPAAAPPSSRSPSARPAAVRPAAPLAVEALGATYRVTRRANLRRGPSERDAVLAVLPVGAEVQVTGRVEGAEWLEVRHGRVQGFVSAGLVEPAATGGGGDSAELPAEPAPAAGGGAGPGAP